MILGGSTENLHFIFWSTQNYIDILVWCFNPCTYRIRQWFFCAWPFLPQPLGFDNKLCWFMFVLSLQYWIFMWIINQWKIGKPHSRGIKQSEPMHIRLQPLLLLDSSAEPDPDCYGIISIGCWLNPMYCCWLTPNALLVELHVFKPFKLLVQFSADCSRLMECELPSHFQFLASSSHCFFLEAASIFWEVRITHQWTKICSFQVVSEIGCLRIGYFIMDGLQP